MTTDAQPTPDAWTTGRLLTWTADYFGKQGLDDTRLAAELLLAHAAGCSRIELYTRFDQPVDKDVRDRFRGLVTRAVACEPIAYLVGEKEFFSLGFHVTKAVLIPRPETESLIETAIDAVRAIGVGRPTILDLGTGSGCIAVTLAKQLAEARVVATDTSAAAIEVARRNAERHGVADRVRFLVADRLDLPGDAVPPDGFDMLVCNPPYIAADAMAQVEATVREYEPAEALTDRGDGLSFYRSITESGRRVIKPTARIVVEIADGRAPHVIETMSAGNEFVHEKTIKDRVTRHDRVLVFSVRP